MNNISERLAQEIERIGGVTAVSKKIETVRNTLYNWISKENIPANKLLLLGELGADIVYILTGVRAGEANAALPKINVEQVEMKLIAMAIEEVESALARHKRKLDPQRKARAVSVLYEYLKKVETLEKGALERFLDAIV